MSKRFLLVIASVVMMAACSAPLQRRDETAIPIAPLTIYMEYASERSAGNATTPLPEARLWFGLARGSIYGELSVTLHEQTGNQREFTLDLNALASVAEKYAGTFSPYAMSFGFRVTPAETRVGRVGTYNYDAMTGNPIGATGFVGPTDRGTLLLVFVDRPCRLYGTITESGFGPTELDALVPTAGFHWLKIVDEGTSNERMIAAPAMTAVTHLTITGHP